jgi:hypothetical protein
MNGIGWFLAGLAAAYSTVIAIAFAAQWFEEREIRRGQS